MDDELVAIDVHTHLATPEAIGHMEAMGAYFKRDVRGVPIEETVAMYRGMRIHAVLFGVDRETRASRIPATTTWLSWWGGTQRRSPASARSIPGRGSSPCRRCAAASRSSACAG